MRTNIAEDLFTIANILTPDECLDLIERGERIGFEPASVSTASGPRMMPNDRATFDDPALAVQLWDRVKPYIPLPPPGTTPIGLNEQFRFYRYDPSQRFHAHRDGVVERSPSDRSRLTFMVYLNEGAAGGQTVFYSEERLEGIRQVVASVEPQMGMGLFFAHEWWHEGAQVLSGRKYVLRTEVMYHFQT